MKLVANLLAKLTKHISFTLKKIAYKVSLLLIILLSKIPDQICLVRKCWV